MKNNSRFKQPDNKAKNGFCLLRKPMGYQRLTLKTFPNLKIERTDPRTRKRWLRIRERSLKAVNEIQLRLPKGATKRASQRLVATKALLEPPTEISLSSKTDRTSTKVTSRPSTTCQLPWFPIQRQALQSNLPKTSRSRKSWKTSMLCSRTIRVA